jgi:hypothetical protein
MYLAAVIGVSFLFLNSDSPDHPSFNLTQAWNLAKGGLLLYAIDKGMTQSQVGRVLGPGRLVGGGIDRVSYDWPAYGIHISYRMDTTLVNDEVPDPKVENAQWFLAWWFSSWFPREPGEDLRELEKKWLRIWYTDQPYLEPP